MPQPKFRVYHCPTVPWFPIAVREFDDKDCAQDFARDVWAYGWVLAEEGTHLDHLMRKNLDKVKKAVT